MRCLSKSLAAAGFAGTLGVLAFASAPAVAQQHFRSTGGWHGTTMHQGAFRDRDDRMGFRDRDDRFRFRDRDDWRWRGGWRPGWRGGVAVGFYGGWPYYGYGYPAYAPYGYGYGYDNSYCDPYSDYYDP